MRIITDADREVFRELAEDGHTWVASDSQIREFFAWVAELGIEGEKYGYPPGFWELHHSLWWHRDYVAGRSPREVVEDFSRPRPPFGKEQSHEAVK
jgi:hypothetical protein